jgi:hypothetical protein
MLSAGLDSTTIVAGLIASGVKPACYTYAVRGGSRELDQTRALTAHFGLEHTTIEVGTTEAEVERDCRDAIRTIERWGKVQVECAVPLLALMRRIAADGHTRVVGGTGGVCEDNKGTIIMVANGAPRAAVDAIRRRNLLGVPIGGTDSFYLCATATGLEYVEPYSTPPLAEVSLSLRFEELHWGNGFKGKGMAVRAFPWFFRQGPFAHGHEAMQVSGGLREVYDEVILGSKRLNPTGAKSVLPVFRRWYTDELGVSPDGRQSALDWRGR